MAKKPHGHAAAATSTHGSAAGLRRAGGVPIPAIRPIN